jgi:hypothetical protein
VDGSFTSLYRYRFTSSVRFPNFFRTKRKDLYGQPYAKNVRIISDPAVSAVGVFTSPGYREDHYRQINVSWQFASVNFAPADDPTQRVANKIRQTLSETKTNTLVTAAELGKTAEHLAGTAKRIYEAYRSIRYGDFRGLADALGIKPKAAQRDIFERKWQKLVKVSGYRRATRKQRLTKAEWLRARKRQADHMSGRKDYESFASNTMLEYSYAWKPLFFDVYSHAQALAEISIERANVDRVVRARADTRSEKTRIDKGNSFTAHRSVYDRRFVEMKCTYRLQGGSVNVFSQFGIDNPLEVVWELVPFSFVADWFLPVGDFLKSLTATVGLTFLNGEKMTRRVTVLTTEMSSSGPYFTGTGISSWSLLGSAVRREESLDQTREAILDFPAPALPSFKNPFGSGSDYGLNKAANAIALLQTIFLKK